ncbi:MAG: hypothetical protein HGA36_05080 [Candidatus Moranbacteria bacterium]|nr:hypothetical protein [Candidatus Moranbacteria bacterium]
MIIKNKILTILIFIAVISINLFFGLPRLAQYTAVDETLWSYDRVPKFWRSVAKGNWKGTNLCDKPGITLAAISGMGLPFIQDPSEYGKLTRKAKTPEQLSTIESIYFHLRLPVYLFTLFSLPLFYFLIKRLLGIAIARFSIIFIGLSPIILGISLIVNTDAILWIMVPISLLSFLIYQKEDNKKFLYLTGFLLGLGILTKFVANFLFPFFLLLIFLAYILKDFSQREEQMVYLKKAITDYFIIILIALVTIFIFYPSAWIKPKELLNTTIYSMALRKMWPFLIGAIAVIAADTYLFKSFTVRKICNLFSSYKTILLKTTGILIFGLITFVFLNVHTSMFFYNFEEIMAMPKPDTIFIYEFFSNLLSSFYPLLFGLTPLVVFSFVAAIIFLIKTKESVKNNVSIYTFYFITFIFAYYFANSLASISSTVRYQIIIYPIASIVAAIGFHQILNTNILKKYHPKNNAYLMMAIILISLVSIVSIKPFFLAYSSTLLPNQYILNPKDMGDGSWEISQYLNNLPNAKNLNVWTDKKQVCEKFLGSCTSGFNLNNTNENNFDYLIVSTGGSMETRSRTWKKDENIFAIGKNIINPADLYSPTSTNYDFKVTIDDKTRNFIKIVKTK